MTNKTMEKRFEKLAKSIVILESKDEWWNGSDDDATLADMDWVKDILAFIKAELKARDGKWVKKCSYFREKEIKIGKIRAGREWRKRIEGMIIKYKKTDKPSYAEREQDSGWNSALSDLLTK